MASRLGGRQSRRRSAQSISIVDGRGLIRAATAAGPEVAPMMSVLFEALVSARHHVAKLRADPKSSSGANRNGNVNFGSWKTKLDALGGTGPLLQQIPTAEEAAQILRANDRPGDSNEARGAWRHATATWHQYDWLNQRLKTLTHPDVEGFLASTLDRSARRDIAGARSADAALALAFDRLRARPQRGAKSAQRVIGPIKFTVTEASVTHGVTRFHAEVSHDDPRANISTMAKAADPRNWRKIYPEIFVSSYRVADPFPSSDRYQEPAEYDDGTPLGESWNGLFFEHTQFTVDGVPVTTFRNVLQVSFQVGANDVYIDYRLHEALSNTVLGVTGPGGPDADRAEHGTCRVTAKGGRVTTRAGKDVRFSEDVNFSAELNAFALPFFSAWITGLLLRSASP